MKLIRSALRVAIILIATLGFFAVESKPTYAFTEGYNLIKVIACSATTSGGVDVLVIYDGNTGDAILAEDPLHLIASSRLCSVGGAFYAVITNGVITAFVFYPGIGQKK